MYNQYFGLNDSPFSIAPNPHYLYMSERHREALAHLLYGIRTDGGFILLTGEVGTGKTTVCRCLLDQIPENVDTAFILNPKLTAVELLATICDDLGIDYPDNATIKGLVDRLNDFLLSSLQADRRTVLIIDEAQNLSADVLEQLRLLTNLETNQRKLLQIILLGQPELLTLLSQPELRQLSQRITARFHLDALDRNEVAEYIEHRLSIAGAQRQLFRPDAINRIYRLSEGIPRLINLICDRALLGAYVENRSLVDTKIVNKAGREILVPGPVEKSSSLLHVGLAACLLLAAVGTVYYYTLPRISTPAITAIEPGETQPVEPAAAGETDTVTAEAGEEGASAPIITATTAQAPDPVDVSTRLTTSLDDISGHTTRSQAFVDLFSLWATPFSPDREPCTFASAVELQCLTQIGSLREIGYLNRPVLVRLTTDQGENWFTLTGLRPRTADIRVGDETFVVDRDALLAAWNGEYSMLWRPPPSYSRPLRRGDSGPDVDWLVNRLDAIENNNSDVETGVAFDDMVESRVKRFQISAGLKPDGIVGTRTWIHINSRINESIPVLNEGQG